MPLLKGHKASKTESGDLNTHNLTLESGQFSGYNFVQEQETQMVYKNSFMTQIRFSLFRNTFSQSNALVFKYF